MRRIESIKVESEKMIEGERNQILYWYLLYQPQWLGDIWIRFWLADLKQPRLTSAGQWQWRDRKKHTETCWYSYHCSHQVLGVCANADGRGADLFPRAESALATMLILGRKSASYCTHRAATAASCRNGKNASLGSCIIYESWKNLLYFTESKEHNKVKQLDQTCKSRKEHSRQETFATAFGGYSPFNLGSTHSSTFSSLNLGVAYVNARRCIIAHYCLGAWLNVK